MTSYFPSKYVNTVYFELSGKYGRIMKDFFTASRISVTRMYGLGGVGMIDILSSIKKLHSQVSTIDIISLHRFDEHLTVLYVNPGAQKVLGYSPNELVGQSVFDYMDLNEAEQLNRIAQWINADMEYTGQIRCRTKAQNWVCLEARMLLLPGGMNEPQILFLARDISARKQSCSIRLEGDKRYRAIVEDQTELVCRFLPDTRITFVNEALCRYFKQSKADLLGQSHLDLLLPENREESLRLLKSLTADNPVFSSEQRVLDADNNIRWLQITDRAIFDDDLNLVEYQFVGHDITERKQAEIALRESEQRLADIINFLPDPTFAIDIGGRLITWNQAVEETTGVLAQDILGKGNYEYSLKFYDTRKPILIDLVLHPDLNMNKHYREYSFIHNTRENLVAEVSVPNWNGKKSDLWCIANPLYDTKGNLVGAIESVRDITDRKQTERALKQSEERYRTLFSTMNEGLALMEVITDSEGNPYDFKYLDVNPMFEKMVGYSRDLLIGRRLREIFSDERSSLRIEQYTKVALTGKPVEFQWYESNMDKYFDVIAFYPGEGQCAALFIDITNRKETELALRLSEEKFSKAFSSSPNLIVLSTINDGCLIEVNDNFCSITGYNRMEVIGRSSAMADLWQNPEELSELKMILTNKGYIRNREVRLRSKSGDEIIGLASAELININNKIYMIGTMIDITEQKQMQEEMARLDRLNLVGEIAASIGHEIRNPMTTVRGFLQLLGNEAIYKEDRPYFELMIEELDRANAIITEFLSLAKNKTVDSKLHNLNSILENVYPLLQADALGQDKRVKLELARIPNVMVDEKEIRQLLLNLVRNGMDAMDAGGTITIKTYVEDDQVVLSIHDRGSGIPSEVLQHLGTPFFTTKEDGTGLGLSVCYSIAARHNASINIETGDTGTTFYIGFQCAS
ncbi:MAG TPA: PAS domain-containing sensor histidine kinase [Syntrophomonas sp.]|jgi:PAS domain S-box-containing protein|nr:PAS domain-containing sensor histidine kinase [Syntrophomonas sp.]